MSIPANGAGVFARMMTLEQAGEDRFLAASAPEAGGRMYGGQFLAQAVLAASRTVAPDRRIHSLHGYFLRAGDVDDVTSYSVERVRDGRAFSARAVVARQRERECFRLLASFHVDEDGPAFAARSAPAVPPAAAVTTSYDDFTATVRGEDAPLWDGAARPMALRYVNPPAAPPGEPVLENQYLWMRIAESLDDEPALHAAALAYLSDSTLVDHVLLPHGQRWQDPRFDGASLDHAMWFHDAGRADGWLLYDQGVEATGHARGLATGRIFTTDGVLLATCAQEGLMRWQP